MSVAQPNPPLLVIHFTKEASVEGGDICGVGKHLQQKEVTMKLFRGSKIVKKFFKENQLVRILSSTQADKLRLVC